MEASTGAPRIPNPSLQPDTEKIKRRLLQKGVFPTPKIIHTLRKKEVQKSIRKSKSKADKTLDKPLSESQKQAMDEEAHFQTISREYRAVTKEFKAKPSYKNGVLMVGKPWERLDKVGFRELASGSKEYGGEKLKGEHLKELSEILEKRNSEDHQWLLDDDIEEGDWLETEKRKEFSPKRPVSDVDAIRFLVDRLSATDLSMRDWKFGRLMKQSGLHFTEGHLLRIVEGLGARGDWRLALSVVEWVYNSNDYKHQKSRFVYTKLLAVLGKARRPNEALQIFNLMREDCHIYPDMAAYHSISVTLGQAGLVKELMNIIECMRHKPPKRIKNMRCKNWDPCLEPDVVVYNAVLNACVPSHQWKGVSWVLDQMRKGGLKPNGATYGLAMEVMLQSGKYDLVHKLFGKMRRSGAPPKAITYKVLVRAFWEEGKVNEAVKAVRDMEQRGVVGAVSVYYELACCLCNNGRWQEAMMEIEKMKKLSLTKPLEVAFTGMIMSCMDGGHVDDCISIFEQMTGHCSPNIGTINAMLKVYGRNDMFVKAKDLFEETKRKSSGFNISVDGGRSSLALDAYTYSSMLEASASAHQWEYFEYVYKEMHLSGYQLDQNKHAWLLVEASIAGKWHLLEHAFDTILEAGEIPHPSLFTEMVCQATVRHNYERAVTLINSMAHASFQVSENQWTDLFTSQDRISKDGLQKLLDTLCSSELVAEATVSNLSKSLLSICGSSPPKDFLCLKAPGDVFSENSLSVDSDEQLDGKSRKMQNSSINMVDGNSDCSGTSWNIGIGYDAFSDHTDSSSEDGIHIALGSDSSTYAGKFEVPFDNAPSSVSVGCVDERSTDSKSREDSEDASMEATLDLLTSQIDESSESQLPSASEILEAWKESRNKEGIFLSFQPQPM
ncbi:Pentatricopeptide repeat [Macleaya cordata]|uniref:Pentatricopeptide repeat n=1 Tax=Macleaya cordata TaxID=56857 RepID=A0A200QG32_MACCD|nr:Pentatricopeptide repeat [Macleaya cordata]